MNWLHFQMVTPKQINPGNFASTSIDHIFWQREAFEMHPTNTTMKILIIEDEIALQESIVKYLEHQGFVCEAVSDFTKGKEKVTQFVYDCIVIDIGLPYGSGLDLVKELKYMESKAGIIIISAKNALEDKLDGLDLGADDYLAKPFYLSELTARINAIIRRRNFEGNKVISFNEIKLEAEAQRVTVNDKSVDLTDKEYRLLEYFMANRLRLLTKNAIAEHIWGDEYLHASNFDFIYAHIKNLRKKLIDAGSEDYIKTEHRSGYRFTDNA